MVSSFVRRRGGRELRTIVVAYNDSEESTEDVLEGGGVFALGTSAMGWAVSVNGGLSWSRHRVTVPDGVGVLRADPWLARGARRGEVFYGFVGTDAEDADDIRYLVIARSTDGGESFPVAVATLDGRAPDVTEAGCGQVDRLTIDVDRSSNRLFASFNNTTGSVCAGTTTDLARSWTVARLPKCTRGLLGLNSHIQVAADGNAFVVADEKDPESAEYQLCLHRLDLEAGTWTMLGAFAERSFARGLQPSFGGSQMRLPLTFSFDIASDGTLVVAFVDQVALPVPCPRPCDLTVCPPCIVTVDHVFVAENSEAGDPAAWSYAEIAPSDAEYQVQPALSAEGDHRAVSYYQTVTADGADPGATTLLEVRTADLFQLPGSEWIPFTLSDVPFEPCSTVPADYFGDYLGIALIDGELIDFFFTAWADARDGCFQQGNVGETYHQHTYGAISP